MNPVTLVSRAALITALTLVGVIGHAPAASAITATFDAGSGIATGYTETGIEVAPDVSGFYVILSGAVSGTNDPRHRGYLT